jgi:hypothetical protein
MAKQKYFSEDLVGQGKDVDVSDPDTVAFLRKVIKIGQSASVLSCNEKDVIEIYATNLAKIVNNLNVKIGTLEDATAHGTSVYEAVVLDADGVERIIAAILKYTRENKKSTSDESLRFLVSKRNYIAGILASTVKSMTIESTASMYEAALWSEVVIKSLVGSMIELVRQEENTCSSDQLVVVKQLFTERYETVKSLASGLTMPTLNMNNDQHFHAQSLYEGILWDQDAIELMTNVYIQMHGGEKVKGNIMAPIMATDDETLRRYVAANLIPTIRTAGAGNLDPNLLYRQTSAFLYSHLLRLPALVALYGVDGVVPVLPLIKYEATEPWTKFDKKLPIAKIRL